MTQTRTQEQYELLDDSEKVNFVRYAEGQWVEDALYRFRDDDEEIVELRQSQIADITFDEVGDCFKVEAVNGEIYIYWMDALADGDEDVETYDKLMQSCFAV